MNRYFWLLISFVVSLGFPTLTFAQAGIDGIMNQIIRGTPGVTNIAINGGVRSAAAGTVAVSASGFTIPVATSAVAEVSGAAVAAGAARVALRFVPYVGAALLAADIANRLHNSPYYACPPPEFFCKPGSLPIPADATNGVWMWTLGGGNTLYSGSSMEIACAVMSKVYGGSYPPNSYNFTAAVRLSPTTAACTVTAIASGDVTRFAQVYLFAKGTCPSNYTLLDSGQCQGPAAAFAKVTQEELQTELNTQFAKDQNLVLAMKNNLDKIALDNPGAEPPIKYADVPVIITAPQTKSLPKVVSTTTIPNADGTTSTQTVTQQTTVTPVVGSPSTVAVPDIKFPSTTTSTTTTTNNTTNVTTTNVINSANPDTVAEPVKIPTDYNRESTQLSILEEIKQFNAPITATAPDGQKELDSVQAKNLEGSNVITGITEGSMGITGWFPKIPTTACRDPLVPNAIGGGQTAVPICDKVNIFSKFISAVICVFALFGCVREVQAALKA